MLPLLYCEVGRDEEARQALEPLAASGFDLPLDVVWGHSVTDCAAACAYLGERAGAALLRERLAPFSAQLVIPGAGVTTGAFAHYLGMLATTLGDYEEAEVQFRAAAALHDRIAAPALLARTRLEWARMLLAGPQPGEAERARDLLGQALATARELGLGNVERRAVALLA